jgi:hypothetical protein
MAALQINTTGVMAEINTLIVEQMTLLNEIHEFNEIIADDSTSSTQRRGAQASLTAHTARLENSNLS